jgi:hypothetical protein
MLLVLAPMFLGALLAVHATPLAAGASPPCSSGSLDSAAIYRVNSLGWDLIHEYTGKSGARRLLVSPVGAWITYATMFSAEPLQDADEQSEYTAILGYTSAAAARRQAGADVASIRHSLSADQVEAAQRLFLAGSGAPPHLTRAPIFSQPCFEYDQAALGQWSPTHTHALVASTIRDVAGGFLSAVGSQALYFDGKPSSQTASTQAIGSLDLTTFEGGADISQSYSERGYFEDDHGVQGVEIPLSGSALTAYLFTAPDSESMFMFETGLDAKEWRNTTTRFSPRYGAVAATLDLETALYYDDFKAPTRILGSFGGTLSVLSQDGHAILDADAMKFAVVTNFQIDDPRCCTDAMPTTSPANPFFMTTVAPMLLVIQDRFGLVLFVVAT